MLKTLIVVAAATAALPAAALAQAQTSKPPTAPAADAACDCAAPQTSASDRWITTRLSDDLPPFVEGAVAQIRDEGDGRFAVMCLKGDAGARLVYQPPQNRRAGIPETDAPLPVMFAIDGAQPIKLDLSVAEAGDYLIGAFDPQSSLATLMKQGWSLRIGVEGAEGVASTYPLAGSWSAISEMMTLCTG